MEKTVQDFVAFLESILKRTMTVEDWNRHVLGTSVHPQVNSSRVRLKQFALSAGQCSYSPIPQGIEPLVLELISELSD